MVAINKERLKSGKLAMRYLADAKVREELRKSDFPLESPTVVSEWETSVEEVLAMINRARVACKTPQAHVLVVIRRDEIIHALIATDSSVDLIGDFISSDDVHGQSVISHVYEALLPRKKWRIDSGMEFEGVRGESAVLSFGNINFELV